MASGKPPVGEGEAHPNHIQTMGGSPTWAPREQPAGSLRPEYGWLNQGVPEEASRQNRLFLLEARGLCSSESTARGPRHYGWPRKSAKVPVVGVASRDNFVICDVDTIRDYIPEYQVAAENRARDAAFLVHHEARDVMHRIRSKALDDRKNVVLDGTGQHLGSYLDMIVRLHHRGYHVKLVMTDIDPETAWLRQTDRAEKTGRSIARHVFDGIYSIVPFNFIPISKAVTDFEMWNTLVETSLYWFGKSKTATRWFTTRHLLQKVPNDPGPWNFQRGVD